MIVSTNVVIDDAFTMQFNNAGRLQDEINTSGICRSRLWIPPPISKTGSD